MTRIQLRPEYRWLGGRVTKASVIDVKTVESDDFYLIVFDLPFQSGDGSPTTSMWVNGAWVERI